MANLPTAHASQTFGRKPIDFYAAPGQVVGSDPRARADERRIQDVDGARHAVRLSDKSTKLEPGDVAAVLRVQPGPARKSRPVAVINYSTNSWTRTEPDAATVLAKAGVARNMNWALSMLALIAAMLVILWPELRAFAVEFFPVTFDMVPGFDVFDVVAGNLPDLASWRIEESFAALIGGLEGAVPALEGWGAQLIFAAGVALGAVAVYSARSWRLLWMPALIGAIGIGAIGLSGPRDAVIPALLGLGATALLFLIGGAINRARDVWRLEQRIARLADHLLRHAPEEMVVPAGAGAHSGGETRDADTISDAQGEAKPENREAQEAEAGDPAPAPAEQDQAGTPLPTRQSATAAAAAQMARESGALRERSDEHEDVRTGEPAQDAAPAESEEALMADEAAPHAQGEDDVAGGPDSFVASGEREGETLEAGEADGPYSPVEPQPGEQESVQSEAGAKPEDPRHSARDISLPPPPPMPKPAGGE